MRARPIAALVTVTASGLLALAPALASAASISISPTSGKVGTTISFTGDASCPDHPGEDAEVFVLVGNFAGNSSVNPRTKVETDDATGAFSGSFAAPDPFESADPRAPLGGVKSYAVSVRCLDAASSEHDGGALIDNPPTFTYTDKLCKVPTLTGKKLADAKTALTKARCAVGKVKKKQAPASKRGRVVKQAVAPKTYLPRDSTVALTIGKL
jgi:hypothetical protein